MVIIGLTGSIGMGKSTAAAMFRREGVPVHDADATVHSLMAKGGAAVPVIDGEFPGVVQDGAVDRKALGGKVFAKPEKLRLLEAILHPLVAWSRDHFLRIQALAGQPVVVLDVPLLFETGTNRLCDYTVLVTAPTFLQKQRVLRRPGMSGERLAHILAQQMPDLEKRMLADVVIETGLGKRPVLRQIQAVIRQCRHKKGRHWPPALGQNNK